MGLLDVLEEQWSQGEPYRASLGGLLYGDTAPLKELLNKKSPITASDPINMGLMFMPISAVGKASLISALKNGGMADGFSLGTITNGQAKQASRLINEPVEQEVFATPNSLRHLYKEKMVRDSYTPEEVAKFAEEAMRPVAHVQAGNSATRFELINRGLRDSETHRPYDALMPIQSNNGLLEMVTVVPKGLPARKK
jgi:hypothetical protein